MHLDGDWPLTTYKTNNNKKMGSHSKKGSHRAFTENLVGLIFESCVINRLGKKEFLSVTCSLYNLYVCLCSKMSFLDAVGGRAGDGLFP